MKKPLTIACTILALAFGVVVESAADDDDYYEDHHGGHYEDHYGGHHGGHYGHSSSHFGLYFGSPLFWGGSPYYRDYSPDYDYPRRTVIIEREPPVYIQRAPQPQPQAQATQLWYYCPNPAGYYPHIASCSQQWVPVDPRSVPPAPSTPPQ